MSKLDDLIKQYCPDGVEYKKLKEISIMQRGSSLTKKNSTIGDYPVISGGKEPAFYCDSFNREGEIITVAGSGAGAGYIQYWNKPIFANDCFTVKNNELTTTKYLYYLLSNVQEDIYNTKKGGGVPHVHISSIENFKFPVPPLPVQEEIVRILDNFTELTTELTARKKQYEYYRDELLKPKNSVAKKYKLKEIGKVCMCKRVMKDQTSSTGEVPFYKIGTFGKKADAYITKELFEEYSKKYSYPKKGDILISCSGTIGRTVVFDGNPSYYQDSNIVWIDNDEKIVTNKYLNYLYQLHPFIVSTGGTISRLYNSGIEEAEVTIPSKETQNKIVNCLDSFDSICSDLNIGLPAEIEARQKQYEYYRDLLLTFAEKGQILETDRQTDRQAIIRLIQYVFGYAVAPFGVVANIVRGASPRPIKSFITDDEDSVNWIKIGDVKPNTKYITETAEKITLDGAKKSRRVNKGDFILSNSMSFGRPYILKIDGCIHDGWLAISEFNEYLTSDYLYHLLNSNSIQREMKKKASFGGAVQNLNADIVKSLELTIPTLEKQNRIVSILDRFDTLCNDISEGLPAEIEARNKQYEYYRDKLLNFKRLN